MSISQDTAILDRVLDPVTEILTPAVARGIADMRATPEVQVRLDEPAERANNGQLTEPERQEYEEYVEALDFIGILQAKARSVLARSDAD